ncbi:hypothetical protein TNCV_1619611 [Trichonephila clavipes]|nr:hypothetical protein TNCV_1619611 [Trichonephila clavipes]
MSRSCGSNKTAQHVHTARATIDLLKRHVSSLGQVSGEYERKTQPLPFTSSVTVTSPSKSKPSIPLIDTAPTTSNIFSTPAAFSSSYKALSSSDESTFTPLPAETCPVVETETSITNTIPSTSQDAKQTSKSRKKDVLKEVLPLK